MLILLHLWAPEGARFEKVREIDYESSSANLLKYDRSSLSLDDSTFSTEPLDTGMLSLAGGRSISATDSVLLCPVRVLFSFSLSSS